MYIVKPIEGSFFESYRENTNYLLEMLDDGLVDGDSLARELLQYLSDDEVGEFISLFVPSATSTVQDEV